MDNQRNNMDNMIIRLGIIFQKDHALRRR